MESGSQREMLEVSGTTFNFDSRDRDSGGSSKVIILSLECTWYPDDCFILSQSMFFTVKSVSQIIPKKYANYLLNYNFVFLSFKVFIENEMKSF